MLLKGRNKVSGTGNMAVARSLNGIKDFHFSGFLIV
jgi:hypothetical protein